MLSLAVPTSSKKGDVTFFSKGIRFSNDFILREKLQNANYVWIFIEKPFVAFGFLESDHPESVKLTNSSKNTAGKTASCSYLKQYAWINDIMLDESVNNRKFTIIKTNEKTNIGIIIKYKVNLAENEEYIPF